MCVLLTESHMIGLISLTGGSNSGRGFTFSASTSLSNVLCSTGSVVIFPKNLVIQGVPCFLRLGFVDLNVFHCLPDSAWADGNLAEASGQLVEDPNQGQPNPVPRVDRTDWTSVKEIQ